MQLGHPSEDFPGKIEDLVMVQRKTGPVSIPPLQIPFQAVVGTVLHQDIAAMDHVGFVFRGLRRGLAFEAFFKDRPVIDILDKVIVALLNEVLVDVF